MSNPQLHLTAEIFSISRKQKEDLNGHQSFVLWFTGLSASGKSSIAKKVEHHLYEKGIRTIILDGDNTRLGINKDLTFSAADREENIRRVAEIAKLMIDNGLVVLASFISPFEKDRMAAKKIIGEANFFEIFIDADLNVCKKRDPKGLYALALKGKIPDFTGISSPYEVPMNPALHVVTNIENLNESTTKVIDFLIPHI